MENKLKISKNLKGEDGYKTFSDVYKRQAEKCEEKNRHRVDRPVEIRRLLNRPNGVHVPILRGEQCELLKEFRGGVNWEVCAPEERSDRRCADDQSRNCIFAGDVERGNEGKSHKMCIRDSMITNQNHQ